MAQDKNSNGVHQNLSYVCHWILYFIELFDSKSNNRKFCILCKRNKSRARWVFWWYLQRVFQFQNALWTFLILDNLNIWIFLINDHSEEKDDLLLYWFDQKDLDYQENNDHPIALGTKFWSWWLWRRWYPISIISLKKMIILIFIKKIMYMIIKQNMKILTSIKNMIILISM